MQTNLINYPCCKRYFKVIQFVADIAWNTNCLECYVRKLLPRENHLLIILKISCVCLYVRESTVYIYISSSQIQRLEIDTIINRSIILVTLESEYMIELKLASQSSVCARCSRTRSWDYIKGCGGHRALAGRVTRPLRSFSESIRGRRWVSALLTCNVTDRVMWDFLWRQGEKLRATRRNVHKLTYYHLSLNLYSGNAVPSIYIFIIFNDGL